MNVSTPAALTQHSPSHWVFFPFWKLPTHLPLQEFTSTQREVQSNENPTQDNNILWNTRHNTFLEKLLLPHFHNILNDAPPGFHITLRNWSLIEVSFKISWHTHKLNYPRTIWNPQRVSYHFLLCYQFKNLLGNEWLYHP